MMFKIYKLISNDILYVICCFVYRSVEICCGRYAGGIRDCIVAIPLRFAGFPQDLGWASVCGAAWWSYSSVRNNECEKHFVLLTLLSMFALLTSCYGD